MNRITPEELREFLTMEDHPGDVAFLDAIERAAEEIVRLQSVNAEMLEALRLYDRTYASTQTNPTVVQEAECIAKVLAAIAKATGGES